MKQLPTLTIGIPAHNEAGNIRQLLQSIFTQSHRNFALKKIVVSSDGSTDKTVEYVRQLAKKHSQIEVIENPTRRGIARGVNQLLARSTSNIFVLLNADIVLSDRSCIEKLIEPILKDQADLTATSLIEASTSSIFEQSLQVSMQLKNVLFETVNGGNNIYTCHGPARAFSKKLYKQFHFPSSSGDDMFSYLYCLKHGFRFQYVKSASVTYKLPSTMHDYLSQSERFYTSKQLFNTQFGKEFVQDALNISPEDYLRAALKSLPIVLRHPTRVAYYIALRLKIMSSQRLRIETDSWDAAATSKVLHL
ncbi:MAG TPA: glycosyltransferase family 2 protein [Candidatus Saccharimonadia bacterium]|nr:glycosyltransferase family 2 protein [Candidatus Saccharimonadia bacterium]